MLRILRSRFPRPRFVSVYLALAAVFGCSGEEVTEARVPVHRARGQVLYKGKPLPEALVVLRPVEPAGKDSSLHPPTGRTDPEGKFQLHTYVGDDGAPAGSYLVAISISPAYSETRDLMKNATATAAP